MLASPHTTVTMKAHKAHLQQRDLAAQVVGLLLQQRSARLGRLSARQRLLQRGAGGAARAGLRSGEPTSAAVGGAGTLAR